jgi:hypothetical protein
VHLATGDYPAGKEEDVLRVEFTVMGIACLGLNGGPEFGGGKKLFAAGTAPARLHAEKIARFEHGHHDRTLRARR